MSAAAHARVTPGRVAGAPISWGVCEAPGWGTQLAPERVLAEMRELGLAATELGPDGYLPDEPGDLRATLAAHQLTLVGGFVTAVLHDPARIADELASVERQARHIAAGGGGVLVLAAATGRDGYEQHAELSGSEWDHLVDAVAQVDEIARRCDLVLAVHQHAGTVVERMADLLRVIDRTDAGLCLDTGHLMVGGIDPEQVARAWPHRIVHVHLKDVRESLADRVFDGEISFTQAVADGLFVPLGDGDAPIAEVVAALEAGGYQGWYVLEQDVRLGVAPAVERAGAPQAGSAAAQREMGRPVRAAAAMVGDAAPGHAGDDRGRSGSLPLACARRSLAYLNSLGGEAAADRDRDRSNNGGVDA